MLEGGSRSGEKLMPLPIEGLEFKCDKNSLDPIRKNWAKLNHHGWLKTWRDAGRDRCGQ